MLFNGDLSRKVMKDITDFNLRKQNAPVINGHPNPRAEVLVWQQLPQEYGNLRVLWQNYWEILLWEDQTILQKQKENHATHSRCVEDYRGGKKEVWS